MKWEVGDRESVMADGVGGMGLGDAAGSGCAVLRKAQSKVEAT